jgi:hypothetical protein
MKAVVDVLQDKISDQKACFVFPSETAASLWARKALELTGTRSLARERFLAWDRFKEAAVRAEKKDYDPVSLVIRKLFVEKLIAENAELIQKAAPQSGLPFRSLIPPRHAAGGHIFASSIAALLPSLKLLEDRQRLYRRAKGDDEDDDFAALKKAYEAFLERHRLFEPAWEKPPLKDRQHEYYLFFPEAMEDFAEYEALLSAEPNIHIIGLERNPKPETLEYYHSARAELRSMVLSILEFHEKEHIPYEDMAISVPGLEDMEHYLIRELELYNIPFHRRSGRALSAYGAGRLFPLLQNCAGENFSFSSLKALLFNGQIPWKQPEINRELIEFGIRNNCVSAFTDRGRTVDVWTEAFKGNRYASSLGTYYEKLKKDIKAICGAKTFTALRRHYFAFRGTGETPGETLGRKAGQEAGNYAGAGFLSFDPLFCPAETYAVLARCIEELSALIELEENYSAYMPASPYRFFLSVLDEKQYVLKQSGGGVNIFPYRVAAASPFRCHFVLNVSQSKGTVLYRPLRFLRQDKRKLLGLGDSDASAVFFSLYRSGLENSHLRFSAAEETFSGWTIAHSFFAGSAVTPPPLPFDPFAAERDWWAKKDTGFPERLFPVQKKSFELWREALDGEPPDKFNMLKAPFSAGTQSGLMTKRVNETQTDGDELKVSATDLNKFYACKTKFALEKFFRLEPFSLEAILLDDTSRGILYHEILRRLFSRIRDEDGAFLPDRLDLYRQWALEFAGETAKSRPEFRGPLAAPILASQAGAMAKAVAKLLAAEVLRFPFYKIKILEEFFECKTNSAALRGKLDRVSVAPEGGAFIIDYKTGQSPSIKASG